MTPFTACSDGTYVDGFYRLVPWQAGFTRVCAVMYRGTLLVTLTGHNALKLAESWARDHAAGKSMAEEVRLTPTGTGDR